MSQSALRRIHALSPQLANQIAAGEVVERPASVVKELLENSLDAGATAIEVEVERGGAALIRVVDDGQGIHPDDLPMAVAPHATSKIHRLEDLEQILSLGFRGEALASIASVSRFSLTSRYGQSDTAYRLTLDGNVRPRVEPAALSRGTSVEVRDLFYNTPARRKFLRTERTEFLHLEEVVRRIALSRFDLALRLVHNGRRVLQLTPATDPESQRRRLAAVLDQGFVRAAREVDSVAAGLRLWGWVLDPAHGRAQADMQYFYLNGRAVRDRLLSHAARLALQERLEPGRHMAYLLYLELDPGQVDVNVHPTKHEVRFRESRMVHDFIYSALQKALGEGATAGAVREETDAYTPPPLVARHHSGGHGLTSHPNQGQAAEYRRLYSVPASPQQFGEEALLQLNDRYLLWQDAQGVTLVDLQRLDHCRARRLMQGLAAGDGLRAQPLLVPVSVVAQPQALSWCETHGELLAYFGLELGILGQQQLVLRQAPELLRRADHRAFLQAMAERLAEGVAEDKAWLVELIVTAARHYAARRYAPAGIAELRQALAEAGCEAAARHMTVTELALQLGMEDGVD